MAGRGGGGAPSGRGARCQPGLPGICWHKTAIKPVTALCPSAGAPLNVVRGHRLREGEVEGDAPGHAQLVQRLHRGDGQQMRQGSCLQARTGQDHGVPGCRRRGEGSQAGAEVWACRGSRPTRLGSPVMTVRAEKSTRLPIRLPRTRPSLPAGGQQEQQVPCRCEQTAIQNGRSMRHSRHGLQAGRLCALHTPQPSPARQWRMPTLEPLANGLDGPAAALLCLRDAWQAVVDVPAGEQGQRRACPHTQAAEMGIAVAVAPSPRAWPNLLKSAARNCAAPCLLHSK